MDLATSSLFSASALVEQCNVLSDADCEWNRGRCVTPSYSLAGKCIAAECGLLSCTCESCRSGTLPWTTLIVSALATASQIRRAYATAAQNLHPDSNSGCVPAARQAFLAAGRARDTMLALAPYISTRDALDAAAEAAYTEAALGEPQPLARSFLSFVSSQTRHLTKAIPHPIASLGWDHIQRAERSWLEGLSLARAVSRAARRMVVQSARYWRQRLSPVVNALRTTWRGFFEWRRLEMASLVSRAARQMVSHTPATGEGSP